MAEPIYMRVDEVAQALGVSKDTAYKVIREMNAKLAQDGWITIRGRVDRKFFYEQYYAANQKGGT